MKITVLHQAHHDWIPSGPDNPAEADEEVRLLHPQMPTSILVKRLVERDSETVLDIPDESVKRMTEDLASAKYGTDKAQRSHLHEIIAKHVLDIVGKHHSPVEHWTDVKCPSDKRLEKHLREQFLPGEEL